MEVTKKMKESMQMSEINFHWIESPYRFPYLREVLLLTSRPKGKPNIGDGLLVGYADIDDAVRVGCAFRRRILYLEDRDFPVDRTSIYNPGHPAFLGWPSEAVDPLSVALGEQSRNVSNVTRRILFPSRLPTFTKRRKALLFGR